MIHIEKVDQGFRAGFWMKRVQILRGVSLSIPKGAIFGFLGANGAGKTTLIHLIAGIRRPLRGTVTIDGLDACSLAARARVGYLPERPYFHEHLSGTALLSYFGALSNMTPAEIKKRIPIVLQEVGMTHAAQLELKNYSKGMLQRIGIAQALLHDPEVLILDEPMSGLDPIGRKEVRELILRMAQAGKTVFFSSHVIPDVEAVCTRVGLIQKGCILGCGTIDELLRNFSGQTEQEYEISFTDVQGNTLRSIAKNQTVAQTKLADILAKQGTILSFSPLRPSLEDLFKGEHQS